jgi:hypothetical protein
LTISRAGKWMEASAKSNNDNDKNNLDFLELWKVARATY